MSLNQSFHSSAIIFYLSLLSPIFPLCRLILIDGYDLIDTQIMSIVLVGIRFEFSSWPPIKSPAAIVLHSNSK